MAISITCEVCGHRFRLKDHCAGKSGRCPECAAFVQVPDENSHTSSPRRFSAAKFVAVLLLLLAVGATTFEVGRRIQAPQNPVAAPGGAAPESAPVAAESSPAAVPVVSSDSVPAPIADSAHPDSAAPPAENGVASDTEPIARAAASPGGSEPKDEEPPQDADKDKVVGNSLADLIERVEPSVVRIDVEQRLGKGNGSGFVVDRQGLIVTNHHVMDGARGATVIFPDGATTPAIGVVSSDAARDIAIIKIEYPAEKLRPIKLARGLPRKGEQVVGFGSPLGFSFSASQGIISAVRPEAEVKAMGLPVSGTWIQTTTPISPGNSGGPLVNLQGEVVAMNTLTLVRGQNLNFALSSVDIRATIEGHPKTELKPLAKLAGPSSPNQPAEPVSEPISEHGRELFAKATEMSLLVSSFSFDPTGRVRTILLFQAEQGVRHAGLTLMSRPTAGTPQMVVTLGFLPVTSTRSEQLLLEAAVTCVEEDSAGRPKTTMAWKASVIIPDVTSQDLRNGQFSQEAELVVARFFQRLKTDRAEAGVKKR